MNYAASRLITWLGRKRRPPYPEETFMADNPALVARWRALPAAPGDSRLLCIGPARGAHAGPAIRVVSPLLLSWYARLVELEQEGPRETWPRWWEMPGGAEEPSAKERLG